MHPEGESERRGLISSFVSYRVVLYLLAAAVGLMGLILIVGSIPGTRTLNWQRDYSGSGVVLLAAALAAAVATASATSFKEQRALDSQRDREQRELAAACDLDQRRHEAEQLREQRENDLKLAWRADQARVYEELISLVLRSFVGGTDLPTEALIRGKVAIWGGEELVETAGAWIRFAAAITKTGGNMTPDQKRQAQQMVGQIVDAARHDLGEQQSAIPTQHAILAMIFNDYERPSP